MSQSLRLKLLILVTFVFFAFAAGRFLYAQSLADSPWPKKQGPSLRNTGQSYYKGPDSADIKWDYYTGDMAYSGCLLIGQDGTIYVGNNSKLIALNPDKSEKWKVNIPYVINHGTLGSDNYIYIGTSHKLYKVDCDSGYFEDNCKFDNNGLPSGWPFCLFPFSGLGAYQSTIVDGKIIFGIGGYGTRFLFALNSNADISWQVPSGDNVEALPAIDIEEGNRDIYMGNNSHQLFKIDLDTGNILHPPYINPVSPGGHGYIHQHIAMGDNGLIYFANASDADPTNSHIFAYNSELIEVWRKQLGRIEVIAPSIGEADGVVYTGGEGTSKLFAFFPEYSDPSNVEPKWSYDLDADFDQAPVIDIDNTVYVVTSNYLYAVVPYDNHAELKWRYPVNDTENLGGWGYLQPAISNDGTMYLLTKDGILRAFGPKNVDIDIKPGSYPNSINLGSNGNVPVAIFSTADFDATQIDPLSITLAGSTVRLKGKGDPMAAYDDINNDGILDIIIHVDTSALELSSTDTEAILMGQTYSGIKIRGVDTVRILDQ